MTETRKGFVPLTEVDSDFVSVALSLPPFIDKSTIGIRVDTLQTLCQLGGIDSLHIISKDTEQDAEQVAIAGISSQGEATAAKIKTKPKEIFHTDSKDNNDPLRSSTYVNGTIFVATDEMGKRVTNDSSAWNTAVWSTELNKAIQQGVAEIGMENLVKNFRSYEKLWFGLESAVMALGLLNPDIERSILILLAMNVLAKLLVEYASFKQGETDRHRMSLFYGPEIDRALILKGMSKRRLVKDLTPKE